MGLVRCSAKPASLAWFMSSSLPKPLKAIPGKRFVKTHFAHQFIAAAIRQSDVADEQVEFL